MKEGYTVHLPTSGGKAGKGRNKTSAIQVRKDGCVVRQFRFNTDDRASYRLAMQRANAYVENR
jgi:hypothetical protein